MKWKILFLVGVGIGYVLGSRAGRKPYDRLKATATQVWEDPRVQKRVHDAEAFVQEKAPVVQAKLGEAAEAAADAVAGLAKNARDRVQSTGTSSDGD